MSESAQLALLQSNDTAETRPNVAFQPPSQLQDGNQSTFVIVNETPAERETFPLSFDDNDVLAVSIAKIVIGTLQICVGIANFFYVVTYTTTVLAFPIWCGSLVSTFSVLQSSLALGVC